MRKKPFFIALLEPADLSNTGLPGPEQLAYLPLVTDKVNAKCKQSDQRHSWGRKRFLQFFNVEQHNDFEVGQTKR